MKRSTYTGSTVVYSYGTPRRADFDSFGMKQLRLAYEMRNELVAIEQHFDALRREADGEIPELAAVDESVCKAAERVADLREQTAQERIKDRTIKIREATAAQLAEAKKALREAKDRRKTVRAEQAKVRREAWQTLEEERKNVQIAIRQGYAGKELHWGTYNDVLQGIDVTRKQIIKRRAEGRPAEFRRQRWAGDGTLHVQNMQQTGKPRRVEWEIVGNHRKHRVLRLRFGLRHTMEIPFVYHRELPCSPQDVTDVRITREVLAGKSRINIQFTCRVAGSSPRKTGAALSVGIGWKRVPEGIRVAHIVSSQPLADIPVDLRPLIHLDAPRHARFILPPYYTWPMERTAHIRGSRDKSIEELRPRALGALEDPAIRDIVHGDPARWRSPARFVALYRTVPAEHPLYAILETWYRRDLHLWQYEANERDQTLAKRDDAYRKLAAWLAGQAQEMEVVVLPDTDYSELKKRAKDSEDTYEAKGSRRQLQIAAPGRLRLYIEQAAQKNGVMVMHAGTEGDRSNAGD